MVWTSCCTRAASLISSSPFPAWVAGLVFGSLRSLLGPALLARLLRADMATSTPGAGGVDGGFSSTVLAAATAIPAAVRRRSSEGRCSSLLFSPMAGAALPAGTAFALTPSETPAGSAERSDRLSPMSFSRTKGCSEEGGSARGLDPPPLMMYSAADLTCCRIGRDPRFSAVTPRFGLSPVSWRQAVQIQSSLDCRRITRWSGDLCTRGAHSPHLSHAMHPLVLGSCISFIAILKLSTSNTSTAPKCTRRLGAATSCGALLGAAPPAKSSAESRGVAAGCGAGGSASGRALEVLAARRGGGAKARTGMSELLEWHSAGAVRAERVGVGTVARIRR
mmetsp:Transcript_114353/g.364528  ORF Transcript_114353/g.364528 Transcript_114353/m.364528 type:complete len:335 (-) Transcript_114353:341-1345(-)